VIDLRSDTVTQPTPAMRAAMAAAEVGDDVLGDDPTALRLQQTAAERFGYEAALFFVSGTQSNLAALMTHCQRGDEYLVGQEAHTYRYEQGGAAVLGSIQPQPLNNQPDGSLALTDLAAAIKPDDAHFCRTRLLTLENTIHGKVLPADYLREALAFARSRGLATHLDGARLLNAMTARGCSEREIASGFDTVSLCLSKGLGAPAGTLLLGSKPLIAQARRWRKVLGGGLRQVGVLAAAGLYALENHVARLAEDHEHARQLGEGLRALGLEVEPVQTNMVFVHVPAERVAGLSARLRQQGIQALIGERSRLVTHLDFSAAHIPRVVDGFRIGLAAGAGR